MKSSASMETVNISAENEALSESQARRQNSVRQNEYEKGKYLFIPMTHFSVDVTYNGEDFKSKRVLAFKLNKAGNKVEYVRTFKISYFTEMLAGLLADGAPEVKPETIDGRLRVPRGILTYTPSCKDRIPKKVDEDNYLHITSPFIIDYQGTLAGYMVAYVKAGDNGEFDVKVNDETGFVEFQSANITQFSVTEQEVTDALIADAKAVLAADSQLKGIKVD